MLLWASGNRDERKWEDPDKFSVDRKNRKSHLAFGSGIHACLGQKLARIEVRVVIEELPKITTNLEMGWQPYCYVPSAFVRFECLHVRDQRLS